MNYQKAVLEDALAIYADRNRVREDLWKEFPASDLVVHIRSKTARIDFLVQRLAKTLPPEEKGQAMLDALEDDALDLINYTAFLVRKMRGEPLVEGREGER